MQRTLLLAAFALATSPCWGNAPDTVTFAARPTAAGDGLEQTVNVAMTIASHSRRDQEVLDRSESQTERRQRRQVFAQRVEAGRVVEATVLFQESLRDEQGVVTHDPVVGKTYHCEIRSDQLHIMTADGLVPPMAEYQVVARAMESLGKPSPLAGFLVGRSVAIGEVIVLPAEVAQQTFGFEDSMGSVDRFELKLKQAESIDGRLVAVFDAEVEATGSGSSQMRLLVGGPLVVEVASCRVVTAELSGPIGMLASRGSLGNTYQVAGTGKLRLEIASRFSDQVR